ncbi:MAG: hypothetical protein ACPG7F_16695 [Aggregatilineales bacterium]
MPKTLQEADKEAKALVNNWTTGAVLTGWLPGSSVFLTVADTAMINQVADAYEVSAFDLENLQSILAGAVTSAVAGGIVSEVVGLIPIAGWGVKSAMMGAKAKIIGEEVIKYFRARSQLRDINVSIDVDLD